METSSTAVLDEMLAEAGLEPSIIKSPWPPPRYSVLGDLETKIKDALTGHHPHPWRGYDIRPEAGDLFDLDPRILRLARPPLGFPSLETLEASAVVDEEAWRHCIGPIWCAFGPDRPEGIEHPACRKGDAIWVHLPWGTFPTFQWEETTRLVFGAMLLANMGIARWIVARSGPRLIWPYHSSTVIPTAIPEGALCAADLEAYLTEE